MPINLPFLIHNLTKLEFDEVDRTVMRYAYTAQNELGRLCDERVYENKLAAFLRDSGMTDTHTQVPVTVTHADFVKVYRLDLLVGHVIYELKTVASFAPQHDAQVLHYAMLANVNHIKLLNFRSAKVCGQLRFNAVRSADRNLPRWLDEHWRALTPACDTLRQCLSDLLVDWGTHLEFHLYEEALTHFFGGESICVRRVPVIHDALELGTHAINSHADGICFVVTAFSDPKCQLPHLQRLRRITGQRAVQWINLNKHDIQLITVTAE